MVTGLLTNLVIQNIVNISPKFLIHPMSYGFYQIVPRTMPIKIDEHIYYRRFDNPADSLSLYRFPIEKLPDW